MMRWLFLLLCCCPVFLLYADIVSLTTGGKIEGEIIEEDDDKIVLRTYSGITIIDRERIEEIERKPTRWQIYSEKSKKIEQYSADAHWELAKWCKEQGLYREFKTELELTLSLNPNHKEALAAYEELRKKREERAKRVRAVKRRPKKKKTTSSGEKPTAREEVPPSVEKKKKIKELINKFFSIPEENYKEREAVIRELAKLEPLSKKDVLSFKRQIFKEAMKGPRASYQGGRGKLNSQLYPGTYYISVPRIKARKYPLLIGLHGGGPGVGDGRTAAQKWAMAARHGAICVFPTVIKKEATAWNKEREEKYVMALIEELKRTFPIDTNKIYLVGHSMGGYGTWSIGTHYADVFAGLSPCAGGIFVMRGGRGGGITLARGTVVNLKNTPIYFYHGADDPRVPPDSDRKAAEVLKELKEKYGPYDYVYKEYNGIGHGLPPGGMGPIIKWLFQKTRNPYPKMVIWEPSREYKSLFWWIKNRGGISQIVAEYNKSKNEITIEGPSSGFSIYLNDKMLNLNKPIRVVINGNEAFNDYATYSVAALLDSIADKRDPEQFFYAKIDF